MKGYFITFEGIEGCGKSTQAVRVHAELVRRGIPATATRDPGGTPAGERIRALLLSEVDHLAPRTEAALYLAARAELAAKIVRPALQRGEVVICDRYVDSFVAYQGYGRGLGAETMVNLSLWATDGLVPDLTFLFDVPVDVAFSRLERMEGRTLDRVERESLEFHMRVRDGFLEIARAEPERVVVLDGTAPEDVVFEQVIEEIVKRVGMPA